MTRIYSGARLLRTLFLALCFLVIGTHSSWAIPPMTVWSPQLKADPIIWKMRSQVRAQGLISQHLSDARQMFYLINESYAANLEGYVAQNLVEKMRKDFDNPRLVVLACYATKQATTYGSRAFVGGGAPEAKALLGQYDGLKAFLTVEMLRQLKDPALIVMAVDVLSEDWYGHGGHSLKEWQLLVNRQDYAVKRAPDWALGHYYNGDLLMSYSNEVRGGDTLNAQDEKSAFDRVLQRAKSQLELAMRLDPGLKPNCYNKLAYVVANLGDPVRGLALFKEGQRLSRFPGGPSSQKAAIASFEKRIQRMKAT